MFWLMFCLVAEKVKESLAHVLCVCVLVERLTLELLFRPKIGKVVKFKHNYLENRSELMGKWPSDLRFVCC